MDLNEVQFAAADGWLPEGGQPAGSVFDKAQRAVNGESLATMQRRMLGQPLSGMSDQDAQRRAYGFFNAAPASPELPRIFNPWERKQDGR